MILRDLLHILDTLAPLRWAESWDNVGLLTGDPAAEIKSALLTIDLTHAVADEAIGKGAELVMAYHPALFDPIKRVRHDSILRKILRADLAVYCPHTALDVAPGGTNDVLADALGLTATAPLRLTAPAENAGLGRVGSLAAPAPRLAIIDRIKRALGVPTVLVAGPVEGDVTRAAVCAGAGRSLLDDALAKKAELYLTGEIPHHDALKAAQAGMTVVCALHSNSERKTLASLKPRLEAAAPDIVFHLSAVDADPFTFR